MNWYPNLIHSYMTVDFHRLQWLTTVNFDFVFHISHKNDWNPFGRKTLPDTFPLCFRKKPSEPTKPGCRRVMATCITNIHQNSWSQKSQTKKGEKLLLLITQPGKISTLSSSTSKKMKCQKLTTRKVASSPPMLFCRNVVFSSSSEDGWWISLNTYMHAIWNCFPRNFGLIYIFKLNPSGTTALNRFDPPTMVGDMRSFDSASKNFDVCKENMRQIDTDHRTGLANEDDDVDDEGGCGSTINLAPEPLLGQKSGFALAWPTEPKTLGSGL